MGLSTRQLKFLRGLAHQLKPIILVGQNGLTDAVMNEIEIALTHHELIKVRLRVDREARSEAIERILHESAAMQVMFIGQVLTIYRRNPKKPKIEIPA